MITSVANQHIRAVQGLLSRRGERKKQDAFVIEGIRTLREAPADRVRELFVTEAFLSACAPSDRALISGLPCGKYTVTDEVMKKVSDTVHPQGVLAVISMLHRAEDDLFPPSAVPLLIVLENLQDPGNLGTILRTGEAAGVTGVLLVGDSADPYNPKVVRSTMGSIFRLPFLHIPTIAECTALLKKRAVAVFAADVRGAVPYDSCDYREATAFLIGNEGAGLSEEALRLSGRRVCIPMAGAVESLNAGVSTAVLAYEAARQRSFPAAEQRRTRAPSP